MLEVMLAAARAIRAAQWSRCKAAEELYKPPQGRSSCWGVVQAMGAAVEPPNGTETGFPWGWYLEKNFHGLLEATFQSHSNKGTVRILWSYCDQIFNALRQILGGTLGGTIRIPFSMGSKIDSSCVLVYKPYFISHALEMYPSFLGRVHANGTENK